MIDFFDNWSRDIGISTPVETAAKKLDEVAARLGLANRAQLFEGPPDDLEIDKASADLTNRALQKIVALAGSRKLAESR